jgi:hypothetical protein
VFFADPGSNPFGDVEVLKAVIGALATVAVAALGLYGVIKSAQKPSRTKPPEGNTSGALENFNGTQNEFMALVVSDNKSLRDGQTELTRKVEQALEELAEVKRHSETFLGAVRRYLMKLATAWGNPGPMPWPDDNDFHILEDTLPNRSRDIERKDS